MIHDAKPFQISDIFDDEKNVRYVIPKYQREYAWGREQWELLLTDLQDNDAGHFLGCAICINNVGALEDAQLEVVDGQQRLTTLSILCAAMYAEMQNRKTEIIELTPRAERKIDNLKFRLVNDADDLPKLQLSSQNANQKDYMYVLSLAGVLTDQTKPDYAGVRRIVKSFMYFQKRLAKLETAELVSLLEKLNKATIVVISVQSTADAFTLFESLNNRGVPLSAMDLVKNRLLSDLEREGKSIEASFDQWKEIVERIPETSAQERFLRHFYSANCHNPDFQVREIKHIKKSQMIGVFETLSKKDPQKLLNALRVQSALYEPLLGEKAHSVYTEEIADLSRVGAVVSFQLVLHLFINFSDKEDFIRGVLQFLVKYFVRRNLTDTPYVRDLEYYVIVPLISYLEENKESVTVQDVQGFMTNSNFAPADDQAFAERLKGDVYQDSREVARFILSKLASHNAGQREVVDLYKRDDQGRLVWTIEHILPKGKNIPAPWVEMIANGDRNKASEIQEQWVHKLGNLTLTGYNSRLSNRSFHEKRDHQSGGRATGYKNGLSINEDVAQKDAWSADDIEKRTQSLAQAAYDLFSF